jgi:hypothetical protein
MKLMLLYIEVLKSYWQNGKEPNIYFYRDKSQNEIDFVIQEEGLLYPIEVKKTSIPVKNDIKNFCLLEQFKLKIGTGTVICLRQSPLPLNETALALLNGQSNYVYCMQRSLLYGDLANTLVCPERQRTAIIIN